jgi:YVTN family beta-propeller protein
MDHRMQAFSYQIWARLALLTSVLIAPCAAIAAPFAYVPNEKSGTLTVIDTANDTFVTEIKAGDKPRGHAIAKDGKTLYVSDQPNNVLVTVDLEATRQNLKVNFGMTDILINPILVKMYSVVPAAVIVSNVVSSEFLITKLFNADDLTI